MVQFVARQLFNPPPEVKNNPIVVLPLTMQLLRTLESAPLPVFARLPRRLQLFNEPPDVAPPEPFAEFAVMIQFEITTLVDSLHTPPPDCSLIPSPALRVEPFVKVKPISAALLVR